MERQASDDLLNSQLWDKIFQELEAGLWDVVVMSPPCNTFSRVRFNWKTSPGPRPLRNFNWPRGFPWLTGSNLQLEQDHNYLVDQTIATAHKCFQCNADFLIEHPEDLGACHGEWPASIWQWETMQQLQQATTWAVFQCHFDAPSPKPTRFLFLPSSLAKSYPMPLGQFSTRSDNTWAPCLRFVDTPRMPSAFWANYPAGSGPPRVPLLTLQRFANTWPSSSPAGWGAQVPLHSAYLLGPLQRLSRQLQPRQLQLDQHLQSLQIVWTNRTIQTPTPSDRKLGKMSSQLEKGRKRLAIEESH